MYNGYKHQISNAQLAAQVEMLEMTQAKRFACVALGIDPDYPGQVRAEMNARLRIAFGIIDSEPNDNGVAPQSNQSPTPASVEDELIF